MCQPTEPQKQSYPSCAMPEGETQAHLDSRAMLGPKNPANAPCTHSPSSPAILPLLPCGTTRAGAVRRGTESWGSAGGPHPATPKHGGASYPQGRLWGTRTHLTATHHSQVRYQAPACKNLSQVLGYFSDSFCKHFSSWGCSGARCIMLSGPSLVWTVNSHIGHNPLPLILKWERNIPSDQSISN